MTKYRQIIGYYNELSYRVEVDGQEIYSAGNSFYDSQTWTSKELGVGLKAMKVFCTRTCYEISKEKNIFVAGIEKED